MSKAPRISAIAGRSVPEWIGKTADAEVPGIVRDRILVRWGSVCHLSGRPIRPGDKWDLDHKKPLSAGGEHRESNLRPALRVEHKKKSAQEAKERAKADRQRRASNGTKAAPKKEMESAGFDPPEPQHKATSVGGKLASIRALPARRMFQ